MIPLLAGWLGMPLKRALGTSLTAIVAMVIPGTIVHAVLGNIDWAFVVVLTIGAVPGARIGASLALGARERTLRVLVGGFMLAVACAYGIGGARRPARGRRSRHYDGCAPMTARRAARAILPALLVMTGSLAGPASGSAVAAAREQTTGVSLALLQQTPWTTNETPQLRVSVVVTNSSGTTLDDISIGVTIGPPIDSRFQYEEALVEGPTSAAFATTYPYEGSMEPGTAATAAFTLDVSTTGAFAEDDSGVYPARVDVRDHGIVLAELNTALIHVVQDPCRPCTSRGGSS